jgi:hypothetical protein
VQTPDGVLTGRDQAIRWVIAHRQYMETHPVYRPESASDHL